VWGVQQQQHSPSFSRSLSSDSTSYLFFSLSSPVFDVYNATGYLNMAQSTFFPWHIPAADGCESVLSTFPDDIKAGNTSRYL
jgi:hypothetical protein